MAKKASKRNRHTGHINAYKASIIKHGTRYYEKRTGKIYYGNVTAPGNGVSIVRVR